MAAQYTPSYTVDNLHNLEQAIALGITEVYYGDKRVGYRSLNEMNQIVLLMKKALGLTDNTNNRVYAEFHSGIYRHDGDCLEGSQGPLTADNTEWYWWR